MSSDRKALLRGSSDIPSMRNWPLFAFLTGLVFFFYVFYVYQAQSTEFAMTRAELNDQTKRVRDLKTELLSVKSDNERLKSSESALKDEKTRLVKEKDTCTSSLRSCKVNSESFQKDKKQIEESLSAKDKQLKDLQTSIDALKKENEELKGKVTTQQNEASQLNEQVRKLTAEINTLKSQVARPAAPVPRAVNDAAAKGGPEVGGGARVQRSVKTEEDQAKAPDEKPVEQAPAPIIEEKSNVDQKTAEDEKKDAPQVAAPPQQPGDRVKLAVAAAEHDDENDKPIVKGGDYEDKLDVEKEVGDDVQPAH